MSKTRVAILSVVVALAAFAVGNVDTRPDCPSEDSCTVDYRDGAWHVTEVTP